MKSLIRTTAYAICFLLLATTNCFAFAIVGDATHVTMSSSANRPNAFSGGEFKLTTNLGDAYAAFCVEWEEHISFKKTYTIDSVENYANRGGGPDNGATWVDGEYRDEVSMATKWLVNEYVNGELKKKYASENSAILGGAMQVAIWSLEEESYGNYENAIVDVANLLISDAQIHIQSLIDVDQFSNVKVVNLIDKYGKRGQSQIIAAPAPVPEPATMLLLGTGLIGLAGFGRKKA